MPDDTIGTERGLAVDETVRLIASDKVEDTPVYDPAGERLGSVKTAMIDKVSGHVAYVVISFGGFLGIGTHYYPMPWKKFRYDTTLGGYVVDVAREQLDRAPQYAADEQPWMDPGYGRTVYDYYGVPFYM